MEPCHSSYTRVRWTLGLTVMIWWSLSIPIFGQHIASGALHNCAVLIPGRVKCWGKGGDGQLGLGSGENIGEAPNQMGPALPFVDLGNEGLVDAIFAGTQHNCAKIKLKGIKCWGRNLGALGYGDTKPRGLHPSEMGDKLPFVQLGTGITPTQLVLGYSNSCALFNNSRVKCWGSNQFGQLGYGDVEARGDGPEEMGNNLPFVDLGEGHTVLQIASGDYHTCAVLNGQQLKCWGRNSAGQLGYGDKLNRGERSNEMGDNLPYVNVGEGRRVTQVETNGGGTCAVLDNGKAKCWGSNRVGQLGLGDKDDRGGSPNQMGDNLPTIDLGENFRVAKVIMGAVHVCALSTRRQLKCWGSGFSGQLGYENRINRGDQAGEMGDRLPFVNLGDNRTILEIDAASTNEHNCVVLDKGEVKCWGKNLFGTLGYGDSRRRGVAAGDMGHNLQPVSLGAKALISEVPIGLSLSPTRSPTMVPTRNPTANPSQIPTGTPTLTPSTSVSPSKFPTSAPTLNPTGGPTFTQGSGASGNFSMAPTLPVTIAPTVAKTLQPTEGPSSTGRENSWEVIASYVVLGLGVMAFLSNPGIVLMRPLKLCFLGIARHCSLETALSEKDGAAATKSDRMCTATTEDKLDLASALVFGICDTCSDVVFVVSISSDEQLDFVFITSMTTLLLFFLVNSFGSFSLASDLNSAKAIEPSDAYIMAILSSFSSFRAILLAAQKEHRANYPRSRRASMISDLIEDIIQAMLGILTFVFVLTKRNAIDSVALVSVALSVLSVGFVLFNLCSESEPSRSNQATESTIHSNSTNRNSRSTRRGQHSGSAPIRTSEDRPEEVAAGDHLAMG